MLKKQSLEYAVFCVYVIVYSCKNVVRSTCGTLSKILAWKSKQLLIQDLLEAT